METTINCTWVLVISEKKLQIDFVEDTTYGWLSYFLIPLTPLTIFYSWPPVFIASRTRIKVLPGGYIIIQYHLILLQYFHLLSFHLLNRYDGNFCHSAMCYILEDNYCPGTG